MTDTTTELDSLPVYKAREVPAGLRTTTQLKAMRLKPAEGQVPVGLVRVYRRGHGWGEFPLYDPADAAKMRPLSAKQQAAKTARRTCPKCKLVREYVVHGQCEPCVLKERREWMALQARTCWKCRRVSAAALPKAQQRHCEPCWVWWRARQQFEEERRAVWERTCPGHPRVDAVHYDCAVRTASDEEIAAGRAAGTWRGPLRCPSCAEAFALWKEGLARRAAEADRRAREARRNEVAELEEWARTVLADPDTVILDLETSGLEDDARIVDIGVYSVRDGVLLDTLIDPGIPIPAAATAVHGITDAMVAGAPRFGDVLERLEAVLDGKRVLIYNRPYDVARLRHEVTLHHLDRAARTAAEEAARSGTVPGDVRERAVAEAAERAKAWIGGMRWEDVMVPYSDWYGDWSDYWGNYAWQPLHGGGHRAISDCRAVVERLKDMARGS